MIMYASPFFGGGVPLKQVLIMAQIHTGFRFSAADFEAVAAHDIFCHSNPTVRTAVFWADSGLDEQSWTCVYIIDAWCLLKDDASQIITNKQADQEGQWRCGCGAGHFDSSVRQEDAVEVAGDTAVMALALSTTLWSNRGAPSARD